MELPLQRSSMGFPGVMVVVWPKRVKRPLSNTWVSRDWPFSATSFTFGYLSFTRFPPGLMRLSPMSFLFLSCWQEPESEQRCRKGGKYTKLSVGLQNLSRRRNSPGQGCSDESDTGTKQQPPGTWVLQQQSHSSSNNWKSEVVGLQSPDKPFIELF